MYCEKSVRQGKVANIGKILQVLIFCVPFYNFLDQVRQRTVHSMKSDTPLVDAMIMFMREFKILASADSVDVLRMLLKQQQLEQYGDSFVPSYVYDAIAKLERFNSMRVSQAFAMDALVSTLTRNSTVISKTQRSFSGSSLKACTTNARLLCKVRLRIVRMTTLFLRRQQ